MKVANERAIIKSWRTAQTVEKLLAPLLAYVQEKDESRVVNRNKSRDARTLEERKRDLEIRYQSEREEASQDW